MSMIEILFIISIILIVRLVVSGIKPVYAHCDTLDGPVVTAAKKAFERRDVNLALVWVGPEAEASVKQAFEQALEKQATATDAAAKAEAEYAFFEHLVKVHREGEGEEYDGLKPAEAVEDEQLADQAIETDNPDEMLSRISSEHNKHIIAHLFDDLREKSNYRTDDLTAGRQYVAAYAHFVHAVGPAINGEDLDGHQAHHHGH